MPFSDKRPNQIDESDLIALVANEPEHRVIDYKRDLIGATDGDKKEFLYDVSSFANTQGGYLVLGVEEGGGVPTSIVGLPGADPDGEILRLEQMVRDGIRPPISGIETAAVTLANGNLAIVMRIPKSWNPPHQVTYQKAFRFYARDTNGKYQIDVDELRSAFALSASVADKMRDFRAGRVAAIASGDAPVTLLNGGALILHVVPFSAVSVAGSFSIQRAAANPNLFPTIPDRFARNFQLTFDGLTVTSNVDAPPVPQRAYTQVFRTGAVEGVASSIARQTDALILPTLEAMIVRYAKIYMRALHSLGLEPPIAVFASLVNVGGFRMIEYFDQMAQLCDLPQVRLSRPTYHFVESIFQQIPGDDRSAAKGLRLTLDHLANAAGLSASPSFDEAGNYTLDLGP